MTSQEENFSAAETISLNRVTNKLVNIYQRSAVKQNSFIINQVQPDFEVTTDKAILLSVLNNLLKTAVSCSWSSNIRVSAKCYNDIILFCIRCNESKDSFRYVSGLNEMKILAEKLGGCISINHFREHSNTITLTFLNHSVRA